MTAPSTATSSAYARSSEKLTVSSNKSKPSTASAIAIPPIKAEAVPVIHRRGLFSPLTLRILAVNVLALAILVGGLLFLDQYRQSLIDAELEALKSQGEIFAAALGEGAVTRGRDDLPVLQATFARQMVRRLVEPVDTRARLYNPDGLLVADSRNLFGRPGMIESSDLPPPDDDVGSAFSRLGQQIDRLFFSIGELEPYYEGVTEHASDYGEAISALRTGEPALAARAVGESGMVLSAAVPVQHYKQAVATILLSRSGDEIIHTLHEVRLGILKVFGLTLVVTVLMSIYLASTIARPIHRLAEVAEAVRRHHDREVVIPDFSAREDEIGDLSVALRDMTAALWRRMDAIESFAADVAHEIKNPLTSLRSAVETAVNIKDPKRQRKLLSIILEDVQRIDRLISDISDASRIDAELSRAERRPVELAALLKALVDMRNLAATERAEGAEGVENKKAITIRFIAEGKGPFVVDGIESRLVRVFDNLFDNALTFSPQGGAIDCKLSRGKEAGAPCLWIAIEDQGPGIPIDTETAIFERFYSERPEGEKFGIHSGLGLSISRQIVIAHDGTLRGENILDGKGKVKGARFLICLPAA
ncbi:MAG: HAMP domain-containing protein [Rhodospirillaceae bacterium]|nr:HAMP domain-containing protein [Rhodospirillaceae bacterium]